MLRRWKDKLPIMVLFLSSEVVTQVYRFFELAEALCDTGMYDLLRNPQ